MPHYSVTARSCFRRPLLPRAGRCGGAQARLHRRVARVSAVAGAVRRL